MKDRNSKIEFFKMAFSIALPIMVQNLIGTLIGTADTVMLGFVSQDAMAASSLANQVYTVFWLAVNGMAAGGCVLASQYWGKGDTDTIDRVIAITMRFNLAISVLFFVASMFFPGTVMRIFTSEQAIIDEGIKYLRIISCGFLLCGFTLTYTSLQRSVERIKMPSITYIVGLVVNVFLNATFIFGLFGAPKLGLSGVALGTLIAEFVQFVICVCHSAKVKTVKFRVKYLFAKTGVLMRDFLKISMPAFINDVVWSLAFSMYSVILGHLGSDAVAANSIANTALDIGAIASRGYSNATAIIVGKALGENEIELAKTYGKWMVRLTLLFALLGGGVMLLLKPAVIGIYSGKLTDTALRYAGLMLMMQAYHIIGEGLNTCWICGCFRGGGDTKFGMITDCLCMWLVAVPLVAIAAFVIKLPVEWVYFVLCLDEFEKMLPVYLHYRKFTWAKNITRESSELEA